jgi:hypothetical protein
LEALKRFPFVTVPLELGIALAGSARKSSTPKRFKFSGRSPAETTLRY